MSICGGTIVSNRIVNANFNEKDYLNKLAKLLEEKEKCERQAYKEIDSLIERNWEGASGGDIFELVTGGIKIKDWEWELDQSNYKEMFSFAKTSSLCYSIDLEDSKLLRGPLVYYYLVCNKVKNGNLKKCQINDYMRNVIEFLEKCKNVLNNYGRKKCSENLEKKYLLGIVDNIRNILLICLNIEIGMENEYKNCFLIEIYNESSFFPYIEFIQTCYNMFEDLLMKDCEIDKTKKNLIEIICLAQNKVRVLFPEVLNLGLENTNSFFRLHREADSMYENYVSMRYCVNQHMKKGSEKRIETIIPCGILSGALELPIVFSKFLSKKISQYNYINMPGDYLERHKVCLQKNIVKDKQGKSIILFDDNVMTGSTLESAINFINNNTVYEVEKCVILRHPEINRIYQMKSYNKAVSIKFLRDKCVGYINHSPYSKIRESTNYGGEFLDEVGVFTLTGEFFLRYLYKNGLYLKESEVDYFGRKKYFKRKD